MSDLPSLPNLPAFLASETFATIRDRMLAYLKAQGIDTSEGSYAYDAVVPAALEIAQQKSDMREFLKRGFARYSFGPYEDHISEQRSGVLRTDAVAARTTIHFTGTAGTQISAGTKVSTQIAAGSTQAAVVFGTLAEATVAEDGAVDVLAECTETGTKGNVGVGALKVLVSTVAGITSVTNQYAVGDGTGDVKGADREGDASLVTRYLAAVRNPPGSGSQYDYVRWAGEVAGVGGVYAEPRAYGANTVRIVLVGDDLLPASMAVLEAVEDYLYAPHRITRQAESLTTSGSGVSVDSTQSDDTGTSVKMVYNAGGTGQVSDQLDLIPLPQAGIWRVIHRVKVNSAAATANLLQIGVYNVTAGEWAPVHRGGASSLATKRAADLSTTFKDVEIEFYWNGTDQVELRVIRLQADTTTTVWIDQVRLISAFMQEGSEPKAPCSDRFYVEAAGQVAVNVQYHPVYAQGAVQATVDAAVEANIQAYLQGLTLSSDNDVRYVRIGSVILDTPGMLDYSGLTINGGTANVAVGPDQVAVLGTVTRT